MTQNTTSEPDETTTPGPSRRTIVQGAAWTIPVIAATVATPLAAASITCDGEGTLDWANDYTRTSTTAGAGTVVVADGRVVPYTVSAQGNSNSTPASNNIEPYPDPDRLNIGAVTPSASPNQDYDAASTLRVTFTFQTPVTDLSFTIGDTENGGPSYREHTAVIVAGSPVNGAPGSNISQTNGRYTGIAAGNVDGLNTPANNVVFFLAGPITSFTVEYTRKTTVAGTGGGIAISNMGFVLPC